MKTKTKTLLYERPLNGLIRPDEEHFSIIFLSSIPAMIRTAVCIFLKHPMGLLVIRLICLT